ncbi:hypothetical protein PHAMO_570002 [Magnetospirillum molischianum DSM 120]|uniref:Uncharacterized protein n=1 Tax=Magnetospirillum molischianum DSM 120 TaxID=1150626 RepID=H8FXB9_MAGML|nr:hypothetical protein PHAMO_570002 [Magnetospirillum molischianum DSM 120]
MQAFLFCLSFRVTFTSFFIPSPGPLSYATFLPDATEILLYEKEVCDPVGNGPQPWPGEDLLASFLSLCKRFCSLSSSREPMESKQEV